jgi:hypothetical protein
MRSSRAAAAIAAVAIISGIAVAHHGAVSVTHPASNLANAHLSSSHQASAQQASVRLVSDDKLAAADPSMAWLASAGGQAAARPR